MKKTSAVDSSVYIFVGVIILIGLLVLAVRWVNKPSCPDNIMFVVSPEGDSKDLFVLEYLDFKTDIDADSYEWDFGDSTGVRKGSKVNHMFRQPGTYVVKLILNEGCEHEQDVIILEDEGFLKSLEAEESKDLPIIDAPNSAFFGQAVEFKESSGFGTSWEWNFGDGERSREQNPSHKFTSTGDYSVRVYINDGVQYATHKITINPKPQAPTTQPRTKPSTGGGAKTKPKPEVKKEVYVDDIKFMKMLNDLAKGKISQKDFKPLLDSESGFTITSNIKVDGENQQLRSFLMGISVAEENPAKKVKLVTTEKGYITDISITK